MREYSKIKYEYECRTLRKFAKMKKVCWKLRMLEKVWENKLKAEKVRKSCNYARKHTNKNNILFWNFEG